MNKTKFSLLSAALVIAITIVLLGAIVSAGPWYFILVMAAAAVWFAAIAIRDRPLTADENRVRADLRRTRP